jgi:cytochrome d ubiquinol oxidase subunit II
MFENASYLFLQQYWWVIISLLASALVFLMFVQGGQTLIYTLGKDKEEKDMLVNALGKKWELTFTTLVTFGGAFFASFPLFYSTSFGGAYWVWIAILFCFIIQAISYEYRNKPNNFLGAKTYEIFLLINGTGGTILIGIAVGTFFTGSQFSVDNMNFSQWETPYRGLEAVLNIQNVALGLSVFFLSRVLAILYFLYNIDDDKIRERSKRHLTYNAIPFLGFFLFFVIRLMTIEGYAYSGETLEVFMEPNKYLQNFLQMPLVLAIFLTGVLLVLFGIYRGVARLSTKAFWFASAGTVLTVLGLFLNIGLNNTSFYPSSFDLQSSLTIQNSSSSEYTLTVMSYVSLFVPFVVAYIAYAWKAISKKPMQRNEMKNESY